MATEGGSFSFSILYYIIVCFNGMALCLCLFDLLVLQLGF